MSYKTVKLTTSDSFEEKKSEFIGYIKRVTTEEEAKEFITEIKSKHKDARHNCWAYIIGQNKNIQRYSDDGEPQGTAGIPILEVIKKNDLTDCAVVVTRYFGGILLGESGLTRAYTKGAVIAINAAGTVEKVLGLRIAIDVDYDLYGKIQYICGENNWHIEDAEFTDKVKVYILSEKEKAEDIKSKIIELTNGKAIIGFDEENIYFKEENRLYLNID